MSEEKKRPGQPTKYKPEYCQQLLDYFSVPPYKQVWKPIPTKHGQLIDVPMDEASDFPTLAGFAIKIGVSRDTLLEWSKAHSEFSGAYKRAIDFQENFLAVNGNKGLIPGPFAIFTAKNILKWRDKQPDEVDTIVNNNVGQISDEELDAKIQEKMKKLEGK